MPQSPKISVALLVLAVALLGAALAARHIEQKITGPLAVAVQGDDVVVAAPGKLYRLDGNGRLQRTDDHVIAADARDAGLYWLGTELLVGPGVDGRFLRCTNDSCVPFSSDPYAPTGPVQVAAATPGKLWLAQTDADRVHRFFETGRRVDMPLSDLQRPGALWQQDEYLYVANTGAGQLERYELHKRGIATPDVIARFPDPASEDDPVDQPRRMLAGGDGSFRVLLANGEQTRGALALVSANGSVQRLALPELANPVSFAVQGDDLLVVDEDRMQVLRIADGNRVTVFGDDAFNAAIGAQHGTQSTLRALFPLLAILAAVLAVVGGSTLARRLLHEEQEPALPVTAGADGVAWLPFDTAMLPRRLVRAALQALPLALFPALLAGLFNHAGAGVAWFAVVTVAAIVPVLLASSKVKVPDELRIGLRGKLLVIEHAQHGAREYPLVQVAWNERQLLPEPGVTLPLERDGIALFHRPTLAASLFPQLNPGKRSD